MDDLLYLHVSRARMEEIRNLVVEVLRESGAKCGLLIDVAGHLLIRKGFTLLQGIEDLAVLIAANRAATQAIAQLLGQEQISVIFHQGGGDNLHSTSIGDQAILTLIFDDRAELSRIQEVVARYNERIAALLIPEADESEPSVEGIQNLVDAADKKMDEIFRPDSQGGEDPVGR